MHLKIYEEIKLKTGYNIEIPSIPKNIDNINHHIQKIFSNLKK